MLQRCVFVFISIPQNLSLTEFQPKVNKIACGGLISAKIEKNFAYGGGLLSEIMLMYQVNLRYLETLSAYYEMGSKISQLQAVGGHRGKKTGKIPKKI